MPAYILARVDVHDPEGYREYTRHTPRAIAAFGGRMLIRGPAPEVLEGPAESRRVVLIEFPSAQAARDFYHGPEYVAVRALRTPFSVAEVLLLDGYDGAGWDQAVAASNALGPLAR